MKAGVQYNDYIGTAAADMSDFESNRIWSYLNQKGVYNDKYEFIGVSFYASGDSGGASFSFICKDKEDGTIKDIAFEKDQTIEEFINFFKRFNVVLGLRYQYEELEKIDDSIETLYIDDRD
ncbi:hypothetical protein [uncultured Duncaniella sp.]|uniref:hypothetical protein n=1 Tax=uncultured Duncaniella sp. TaxID=2768039 RepID=UPI002732386C|nr:hypothetical protein [uncultured Duncaniella sp.]